MIHIKSQSKVKSPGEKIMLGLLDMPSRGLVQQVKKNILSGELNIVDDENIQLDSFSESHYLGKNADSIFSKIQYQVWQQVFDGVHRLLCMDDNVWITPKVLSFEKSKISIQQAVVDGLLNIAPYILVYNLSAMELRSRLGKSLWRKICGKTLEKNMQIASHLEEWSETPGFGQRQVIRGMIAMLLKLPDEFAVAAHGFPISIVQWSFSVFEKNSTDSLALWNSWLCLAKETADMMGLAYGMSPDWKWSFQRMQRERDAALRDLEIKNALENPTGYFNFENDWIKEISTGYCWAKLLLSESQVIAEGKIMQHCVEEYINEIHAGLYLVYALSLHGERTTLGVIVDRENKRLQIDQHSGKANREINTRRYASFYRLLTDLKPGVWKNTA